MPGGLCCVTKCSTKKEDRRHLYRIPKDTDQRGRKDPAKTERRESWLRALNRDITKLNLERARVCQIHFITGKPVEDSTHPDWAPTLQMGHDLDLSDDDEEPATKLARFDEQKEQERARTLVTIGEQCTAAAEAPESPPHTQEYLPIVVTPEAHREAIKLRQLTQAAETKELLVMNEEMIKQNAFYIKFYTGLPNYIAVKEVCKTIEPYVDKTSKLSAFQQLMLTLMKLRLGFLLTDLAFRFQIHRTTASRIFYKVVDLLYYRFKNFVRWPTREEIIAKMPPAYKEQFGNKVAVIVDCFEIFIEKGGNPDIRSSTWSSYKHHNTIKLLIGITPHGCISFISPAYTGKSSDTFLTENCGILNNLLPGDVVLADRGFFIEQTVRTCQATLHRPAFLSGQKQLSPFDIEETRKLANVRIQVERIIGLLRRKYKILFSVLPMSILNECKNENVATIDKIVHVCCALVNLNKQIV